MTADYALDVMSTKPGALWWILHNSLITFFENATLYSGLHSSLIVLIHLCPWRTTSHIAIFNPL